MIAVQVESGCIVIHMSQRSLRPVAIILSIFALLAVMLVANPVGPVQADGTLSFGPTKFFGPTKTCPNAVPVGEIGTYDFATSDMNGDGNLDVITGNFVPGEEEDHSCIGVWLGNGRGQFASEQQFTTDGVCTPSDPSESKFTSNTNIPMTVKSADVNKDGRPDVVTGGWGSNCVGVFLNSTPKRSSTVTFTKPNPTLYGSCWAFSGPGWVTLSDVDRDGDLDIIPVSGNENKSGAKASVMTNNGKGSFSSMCKAPYDERFTGIGGLLRLDYPQSVATGDFNADGYPDVLAVKNNSDDATGASVVINKKSAPGTFFRPRQLKWSGSGSMTWIGGYQSAATGDLTKNGNSDIVISDAANERLVIIKNGTKKGSATFSGRTSFINATASKSVVLADVNSDGKLDAVTNPAGILLGNGNGTFKSERLFSVQVDEDNQAEVTRAADVNNDGRLDLIGTLHGQGIGVRLNTSDLVIAKTPVMKSIDYRSGAVVLNTRRPLGATSVQYRTKINRNNQSFGPWKKASSRQRIPANLKTGIWIQTRAVNNTRTGSVTQTLAQLVKSPSTRGEVSRCVPPDVRNLQFWSGKRASVGLARVGTGCVTWRMKRSDSANYSSWKSLKAKTKRVTVNKLKVTKTAKIQLRSGGKIVTVSVRIPQ